MKTLVVGIGNPLKKDDNIGNVIAIEISKEYDTIIAEVNPEAFLNKMKDYDVIIFLDAVEFNSLPGDVRLFSLEEVTDRAFSTHSTPFSLISSMLKSKKAVVIGIQPKDTGYGIGLSEELKSMKEDIKKKTKKLLNEILS